MTPPTVLAIAPGVAPGGLVFRITADDGTVLSEEAITEEDIDLAELMASRQGTIAGEHVDRVGRPTVLYIFDGDSGQCIGALVSSAERDMSTPTKERERWT